jgi:hypothetical protein
MHYSSHGLLRYRLSNSSDSKKGWRTGKSVYSLNPCSEQNTLAMALDSDITEFELQNTLLCHTRPINHLAVSPEHSRLISIGAFASSSQPHALSLTIIRRRFKGCRVVCCVRREAFPSRTTFQWPSYGCYLGES